MNEELDQNLSSLGNSNVFFVFLFFFVLSFNSPFTRHTFDICNQFISSYLKIQHTAPLFRCCDLTLFCDSVSGKRKKEKKWMTNRTNTSSFPRLPGTTAIFFTRLTQIRNVPGSWKRSTRGRDGDKAVKYLRTVSLLTTQQAQYSDCRHVIGFSCLQ